MTGTQHPTDCHTAALTTPAAERHQGQMPNPPLKPLPGSVYRPEPLMP